MCKNFKQGIQCEINYLGISLFGKKLNVKIIGGGRAAFIKGKTFLEKGCNVSFLAKDISKEILNLNKYKVKILKENYNKKFIKDGHIIIIAIDDAELRKIIIEHCEELNKIYINCSSFENGMGIVQTTRELNNLSFSINTKVAAPALSVMLSNDVEKLLSSYDDFTYLVGKIRKVAKNEKYKKEIIKFICTHDFKFFYDLKKEKEVLALFFGEEVAKRLLY
ncbi:NAD(P)-dependent oxidoreductase [Clostridium tarantellae]|uniref:precorrin-2 dehydrogenase n=1 Tax=Clostridium tarantellae TaxID=39493 RepID=A0A6I1MM32_9CLOT|nr:NAD(P)-dependent oxidoreductase [Clostridium tarantellae]MPQ44050.1 NAD(P)-dependent oxidoreductase [Clostridium tarantellae]